MSQQGADLIGRTLGRTYQIERLLGGGGMGAVYAGRHVRTGGLFAVKILHQETSADTDIYKRFQDEARTVSALRHPHIVQVTDFDRDDDGTPFIVMELLEGEDLYQRLCRVGKLSVEQVLDIGRQVGSALHAAHEKGVIHRDIKPQNIFLVRHEVADLVTEVAKVVDFGISKIRRTGAQMTRDMTILGTPQFMSPEAALGQNSQLDGRADQWSLAVIMYLSLTGRLPFDGDNLVGVLYMVVHEQPVRLKQLAPDVPDTLIIAIERAMSKKKEDRYPRMVDFVRAMSGLGATGGASMRLSPVHSAMIRGVPQELVGKPALLGQPGQVASDAPTAAPHLLAGASAVHPRAPTPQQQRSPSVPQVRTPTPGQPQQQLASDAPTKAAHMVGVTPGSELNPLTVPMGQHPELVATPTAPTAFSPLGVGPVAPPPRQRAPQPSGNTPTNIAISDFELQQLLDGSSTTPDSTEAVDLQGVPTRVASMPPSSSDATVARYDMPTTATVPLGLVKRPSDPAYSSTLSHATGQEVSLRPRLLPQWSTVRDVTLRLCGFMPRSSIRLAVTGGVLTLLLVLIIILLVSGGASTGDGKGGAATTPAGGAGSESNLPSLLADGGTRGGASSGQGAGPGAVPKKDPKTAGPAAGHDSAGVDDKNAGKPRSGKSSGPKKPGGKGGADAKKHS